jgi:putative SOS response-associated peptidase YedK
MCGRDAEFYTWKDIHAFSQPLTIEVALPDPTPNYNRAPTHSGGVIVAGDEGNGVARRMRWGLIPFWAKDGKVAYTTINARVETASTKPAFREAWKRRRCLVPSSGYFEWQVLADGKTKQPFFIRNVQSPILMFAGLWERWNGPEGELETYSVVTRDSAGPVSRIHDRMPLTLTPELLRDWLHGTADDAAAIAQAAPLPELDFYPVSRAVGNVRNTGEQLIAPLQDPAPDLPALFQ